MSRLRFANIVTGDISQIILILVIFLAFIMLREGCHKPTIDERIHELTDRIGGNPKDTNAYLDRAQAYEAKGEERNALGDLTSLLQLGYNSPKVYLRRSLILHSLRADDFAAVEATHAIRLGESRGMLIRAMYNIYAGNYGPALVDLENYVLFDTTALVQYSGSMAVCSFALGEYKAAIYYWKRSREEFSGVRRPREIAAAFAAISDYQNALQYADSITFSGLRDSLESSYFTGSILLETQDFRGAIDAFQRSIDAQILTRPSLFGMSRAYAALKDRTTADKYYHMALESGFIFNDVADKLHLGTSIRTIHVAMKNDGTRTESDAWNAIKKREKILTFDEARIAEERMAVIFAIPSYQDEYRRLFCMFVTLADDLEDLPLWQTISSHPGWAG